MFPPFDEEAARKVCAEMMRELEEKKSLFGNSGFYSFKGMFGVLVCADREGNEVVLRAFSGASGGRWNIEGFSPPLFDEEEYKRAVLLNDKEIHELSVAPKNETAEEKSERKKKRLALCNETLARLYSLYKFTCADLSVRDFAFLKNSIEYENGSGFAGAVGGAGQSRNKGGSSKRGFVIPTGVGDCCAPKLLNEAFSKKLLPVSLAEFYWEASERARASTQKEASSRRLVSKNFYPPCDEKCSLILPLMLGLKIVYRDNHIIVVDKPSGLLSVPGRGEDKQDCVVQRVRRLFPAAIEQPSVHRLDMDTSGLLVLAFDSESHKNLSMQFEGGAVKKKYIAILEGNLKKRLSEKSGRIELRHRVDIENRPRQILDDIHGKKAVTLWEILKVWNMGILPNGKKRVVTSVAFEPLTGRTHQLRFASAHPLGLNTPIVGDNIYACQKAGEGGAASAECERTGERLLLHASYLCFKHPATGALLEFNSAPRFKF